MDNPTLARIVETWSQGGWTMIPLAGLCVLIWYAALRLFGYFRRREYRRVNEATWAGWVRSPEHAKGEVGEIIRYTQDGVKSADEIHNRFTEVTSAKLPVIDRRLTVLNVMVAAAPLIGLLGTVLGMLGLFRGLAGGGGEITDEMSRGIMKALLPPQTGLSVALPGLILVHLIRRKRQEYEAFLARLESFTIQTFRKRGFGWEKEANLREEQGLAGVVGRTKAATV
jgi:biopolymer transport protein ExbB